MKFYSFLLFCLLQLNQVNPITAQEDFKQNNDSPKRSRSQEDSIEQGESHKKSKRHEVKVIDRKASLGTLSLIPDEIITIIFENLLPPHPLCVNSKSSDNNEMRATFNAVYHTSRKLRSFLFPAIQWFIMDRNEPNKNIGVFKIIPNVQYLDLSNSSLDGYSAIPVRQLLNLKQYKKLSFLFLDACTTVSEDVWKTFHEVENLTLLSVADTRVNAQKIRALQPLPKLQVLNLAYNDMLLDRNCLSHLAKIATQLGFLSIPQQFTNDSMEGLMQLTSLKTLHSSIGRIPGVTPASWRALAEGMPKLELVRMVLFRDAAFIYLNSGKFPLSFNDAARGFYAQHTSRLESLFPPNAMLVHQGG